MASAGVEVVLAILAAVEVEAVSPVTRKASEKDGLAAEVKAVASKAAANPRRSTETLPDGGRLVETASAKGI